MEELQILKKNASFIHKFDLNLLHNNEEHNLQGGNTFKLNISY